MVQVVFGKHCNLVVVDVATCVVAAVGVVEVVAAAILIASVKKSWQDPGRHLVVTMRVFDLRQLKRVVVVVLVLRVR